MGLFQEPHGHTPFLSMSSAHTHLALGAMAGLSPKQGAPHQPVSDSSDSKLGGSQARGHPTLLPRWLLSDSVAALCHVPLGPRASPFLLGLCSRTDNSKNNSSTRPLHNPAMRLPWRRGPDKNTMLPVTGS